MNRGGGWRGGRGGSGNGDQGGGNRRGNGRGVVVRFPSDSNRRDAGRDHTPRFPSDSNAKDSLSPFGGTPGSESRTDSRSDSRSDRRPQSSRDGQARDAQKGAGRERSARDQGPRAQRPARDNAGRPQGGRGQRFHGERRGNRPQTEAAAANGLELVEEVIEAGAEGQGAWQRIDPFELFCAFHLGITRDDSYRQPNVNDVARRFSVPPAAVKQALQSHRMDPEAVVASGFDMAMAQIDIQVSPPGVSKTELARGLYEEYLQAVRGREWPEPHAEEALNARA